MKFIIVINDLSEKQLMNPDTTQNTIQFSAAFNDSVPSVQIDSLSFKSDSTVSLFPETKIKNRFITEKDIVKKLPDSNSVTMVSDWVTILIFTGFILAAIINFLFRKDLSLIFKSVLRRTQTNQLIREGNPFRKRITLILTLIYLISIPLLYYFFIENYTGFEINIPTGITLYLKLALLVLGFFVYKALFIKLIAFIFETQKSSFELLINILIFNLVIGILVLPLIALFIYAQFSIFLQLSIGIYFIGISLRTIRILQVGLTESNFSVLHLFLYLCTLEFVPIIIISKMIINYFV